MELRRFNKAGSRSRVALDVQSDLSIGEQVTVRATTWLDRQLIARDPVALDDAGFGAEVRDALVRCQAHLIEQGIARQNGKRTYYPRGMLTTLPRRERDDLVRKLERETEMAHSPAVAGEYVTRTYRRRFALAAAPMAMIDDRLQSQFVRWPPSREKQRGRHVSGVECDMWGTECRRKGRLPHAGKVAVF
ncbi:DUF3363 domain-containing protein [Novacetimonas hansenii]|uniref:Uncharacterized protein n=2 Tax=Novacetimonas hansenii TaxID=436 RepID=A0ABQ0SHQ3_NOVHA|nr:DUF3363 domain-containing protein [Novacetimonas hansenii]EFG84349.1 hypothetical protein GXY_08564 [Novacetimonas hansenii ATCC 23769]GAN84583.1 hypothetical protein Gaha_0190_001 [Novacetimonas hansenii JCM 7643]GBQ58971.1 hypothetical protein AA0243_1939 [Novacetimonas hansenii NRIC 0243]GEC64703.1 hypothetical protein GHA01_25520 [Novacetimonas hansenii]